jgi:hypothetical protein
MMLNPPQKRGPPMDANDPRKRAYLMPHQLAQMAPQLHPQMHPQMPPHMSPHMPQQM